MRVPLKIETRPSPHDYTLKSVFEQNKHKAPVICSPSYVKVDGDHQTQYTDTLGIHLHSKKLNEDSRRDRPLGPGEYQAATQGTISQNPNPPEYKFGTAIQRDDSFLTVGVDPNMNVCPAKYDETKFLKPVSTHISLEKKLCVGNAKKNFDFRRVGQL